MEDWLLFTGFPPSWAPCYCLRLTVGWLVAATEGVARERVENEGLWRVFMRDLQHYDPPHPHPHPRPRPS